MPSLMHCTVIAQDTVEVVAFAHETGFAEQRFGSRDDTITLSSLGVLLPLTEIYRDTGLS